MTPGEFQLFARGWLDANAPHGGPVTKADVRQVDAMREHSRMMREREKAAKRLSAAGGAREVQSAAAGD